jgi:hypothetical protein
MMPSNQTQVRIRKSDDDKTKEGAAFFTSLNHLTLSDKDDNGNRYELEFHYARKKKKKETHSILSLWIIE